jgi:hypothetical protein
VKGRSQVDCDGCVNGKREEGGGALLKEEVRGRVRVLVSLEYVYIYVYMCSFFSS